MIHLILLSTFILNVVSKFSLSKSFLRSNGNDLWFKVYISMKSGMN